jgi:hypothetical protein
MTAPETPTKRQATQHGCLPSFLCDGDKGIETVYGEEKKYFVLCRLERLRQNENLLYQPRKDPFQLSALSPAAPSFNSQQRPPLSSFSGHHNPAIYKFRNDRTMQLLTSGKCTLRDTSFKQFARTKNQLYTRNAMSQVHSWASSLNTIAASSSFRWLA